MTHSTVVANYGMDSPMLRVRCFGRFYIAGQMEWHHGPSQKRAREVVQYLVLHPQSVASPERLRDFLWPGETSVAVAHRLHSAISGARTFLRNLLDGFNAIRCDDEGYSWHPKVRLDSDVEQFADLYRDGSIGAIKHALPLYAGELLEGQDGDWVRPARLKYACMYASMVERLALEAFDAHRFDEALLGALQLLEIDRAHESASRLAIRCFDALGQRGQAQLTYSALRAYLHEFLGVEPMPETTELFRAVMHVR